MTPRRPEVENSQADLFGILLENIVNQRHPLIKLSERINWEVFDEKFGCLYDPKKGRPGCSTRLMAGLHYLKYTYDLSDEEVSERWSENAYWQYFCGEKYFEYKEPLNPSSMSKWRKKIGSDGAEELLKETITTALRMKAVKVRELENLNVDTTVQEKAITYPTDSKLYNKLRSNLVTLAKSHKVQLRQSYVRVGRQALVQANRYFHARQYKRARREVRRLKSYLRRTASDIRRKIAGNTAPEEAFSHLLSLSDKLLAQEKTDKNKIYSIHAPEVECIAKGKAHKKYEFGNKVSIVSTSKRGLVIGAQAFHGNPYDGHTLSEALSQAERLCDRELTGNVFVDQGYKGHNYKGSATINIARAKRLTPKLRRWMKRRSAIEAKIGHMKNDSRMDRNYLLGKEGDKTNAMLCAAAMNVRFLLAVIYAAIHFFVFSLLNFAKSNLRCLRLTVVHTTTAYCSG